LTFLLDTNAVSEPGRKMPDSGFASWFSIVPEADLFISTITLGELRRGVTMFPDPVRRTRLEALYSNIARRFSDRILPIDAEVGEAWGDLSARLQKIGRMGGMADELIAATALVRDLTLVTRNVRHFEAAGCRVHCPWSS
jgi:predicted nucleic acid-binding protein